MWESSLKYRAAEREVLWGQVPQDPARGGSWRDLTALPAPIPPPPSLPPPALPCLPFPPPHLVPVPSPPRMEPCGNWHAGRDLQDAGWFPMQGGGKGTFIASYSLLTWSRNVQKLRLLFHSFRDLLCSDISNNQEEERICRGNFRAWLMPFVSSAGQSTQRGRESRSTILQARLTGL